MVVLNCWEKCIKNKKQNKTVFGWFCDNLAECHPCLWSPPPKTPPPKNSMNASWRGCPLLRGVAERAGIAAEVNSRFYFHMQIWKLSFLKLGEEHQNGQSWSLIIWGGGTLIYSHSDWLHLTRVHVKNQHLPVVAEEEEPEMRLCSICIWKTWINPEL